MMTADVGQSTFSCLAVSKVPESSTLALLGVGFIYYHEWLVSRRKISVNLNG